MKKEFLTVCNFFTVVFSSKKEQNSFLETVESIFNSLDKGKQNNDMYQSLLFAAAKKMKFEIRF
jgi:hypothetical protein